MPRLSEEDKQFVLAQVRIEVRKELTATEQQPSQTNDLKTLIAEAIKDAQKPLLAEISSLRDVVNETNDQLTALQNKLIEKDAIIKELKDQVANSAQKNIELNSLIMEKHDELESYSRKDSLRISGIEFDEEEDNNSLQEVVISTLAEQDINISKNDIFRLHRASKPFPMNKYKQYLNKVNKTKQPIDTNDTTQTAEVIVKFNNWSARSKVYKHHYQKDAFLRVKCDLTKYRQGLLQTARDYLKDHKYKAYVYCNSECRLVIKNVNNNRTNIFNNFEEFKHLCTALVVDPKFHEKRSPPS